MAKKAFLLLALLGVCAFALLGRAQQLPDAPPAQLRMTLQHPNEPTPGPPHSPSFGESGDRTPGSLGAPLAEVAAIQPSASPALYLQPPAVEQAHRGRVLDKTFIALAVLAFASTSADVELTQHCLQERTCVEMNPTLPHSRWGMYAVNTPVNVALMYLSYHRKSAGKWGWWIAPVGVLGAHGVGVASNIRFALR
jgi:hypothetical protein